MAKCPRCEAIVRWDWELSNYVLGPNGEGVAKQVESKVKATAADDLFYLIHRFCACGEWLGLSVQDGENAIDVHIGAEISNPAFDYIDDWEDPEHCVTALTR